MHLAVASVSYGHISSCTLFTVPGEVLFTVASGSKAGVAVVTVNVQRFPELIQGGQPSHYDINVAPSSGPACQHGKYR